MNNLTTDKFEAQLINEARNRVLYDGYKNSLIEWTLSDEWTHVERETENQPRGVLKRAGFLITLNACSGEI